MTDTFENESVATHETSSQTSGNSGNALLHNVYHHLVLYFFMKLQRPKNKSVYGTVLKNDIYAHGIDVNYYYYY